MEEYPKKTSHGKLYFGKDSLAGRFPARFVLQSNIRFFEKNGVWSAENNELSGIRHLSRASTAKLESGGALQGNLHGVVSVQDRVRQGGAVRGNFAAPFGAAGTEKRSGNGAGSGRTGRAGLGAFVFRQEQIFLFPAIPLVNLIKLPYIRQMGK